MLAAIVAVIIMISLIGLVTYKQSQPTKLERIGLELGIEVEII